MAQEPTVDQVIGANVAALRSAVGLSQPDLGRRMVEEGFTAWRHRQTVAAVEAGVREATRPELLALAQLLDAPSPRAFLYVRAEVPRIRLGDRTVERDEWNEAWAVSDEDAASLVYRTGFFSPQRRSRAKATFARMRERSVLAERERNLAARARFPGPTFVADHALNIQVSVPPTHAELRLDAGQPWTARDRFEAAALREAEAKGQVRRVERHAAQRMRERRKR